MPEACRKAQRKCADKLKGYTLKRDEDRTPEPVGEEGHQDESQPTADDGRRTSARSAQANKADHVECGHGKGWVRSAHECDEAKAVMSFALNPVRR
jgi:hypothetical protein